MPVPNRRRSQVARSAWPSSARRVFLALGAALHLAATSAAAQAPPRGPSIEAEAKDEPSGLRLRWTVRAERATLREVTVTVRKDGRVLRTASTTEPSGQYHFDPYRPGKFRLDVSVVTTDGRSSARTVELTTAGNEPSPCPSRAVWMPPMTDAVFKGFRHYSVAELVRQSSLIVAGDVTAIEFCQPETSTIPFTFVTFSGLSVIRGARTPAELTLAFAGGVMDGAVSDFEDMPKFDRRQRYVLFVTARPRYRLVPTVGWSEGVFTVDADGVRTYAGDTVTGLDGATHELVLAAAATPRPVRFDPAYGVYHIVGGGRSEPRVGPPGRVVTPPPGDATPISEAAFAESVRTVIREIGIPDAREGRLLPPGSPFMMRPVSPAGPGRPQPVEERR